MTRHGISTSGLPQPTAVFIADSAPKPFGRALTPRRRWLRAVIAAAGSALFAAMAFAPGATAQNQDHPLVALQSLHPIVQQVLPAVVNVSVATSGGPEGGFAGPGGAEFGPNFPTPPFDEFLRRYFGEQGLPGEPFWPGRPRGLENVSLGSGFIIDRAGYVVTDYHVVERAGRITVVLQDNSRHPAKLVGCDALSDLALLKIEGGGPLPSLQWGDSDAAQVGDWVMAVGNPFGLGGTVTAGIISARGRNIQAGPYDFLQIDAPINRGNSGGPTFNMDGHVIGVNTAILSPSGGFIGIGFAIPSSVAKPVIDQLREHGTVERGWLGLQIQPLTADIAESLGRVDDKGALVAAVAPDGPATWAGVRPGDIVLMFAGKRIDEPRDLSLAVAITPVGQETTLTVWRNGQELELHPVIAPAPWRRESARREPPWQAPFP